MAQVYFDPAVGGDGTTVSDDANPTTGLANGGHRTRFVPALAQVVAVAQDVVGHAEDVAAVAESILNSPATQATSTTSLAIGTGSKSLTLAQTGKSFVVGQYVQIVNTSNPANFMVGGITAFNSATGAMTVTVSQIGGAGTIAAWAITPSSPPLPELPVQTGNTGKFLQTNGTVVSWQEVPPSTPFANNTSLAQVHAIALSF